MLVYYLTLLLRARRCGRGQLPSRSNCKGPHGLPCAVTPPLRTRPLDARFLARRSCVTGDGREKRRNVIVPGAAFVLLSLRRGEVRRVPSCEPLSLTHCGAQRDRGGARSIASAPQAAPRKPYHVARAAVPQAWLANDSSQLFAQISPGPSLSPLAAESRKNPAWGEAARFPRDVLSTTRSQSLAEATWRHAFLLARGESPLEQTPLPVSMATCRFRRPASLAPTFLFLAFLPPCANREVANSLPTRSNRCSSSSMPGLRLPAIGSIVYLRHCL